MGLSHEDRVSFDLWIRDISVDRHRLRSRRPAQFSDSFCHFLGEHVGSMLGDFPQIVVRLSSLFTFQRFELCDCYFEEEQIEEGQEKIFILVFLGVSTLGLGHLGEWCFFYCQLNFVACVLSAAAKATAALRFIAIPPLHQNLRLSSDQDVWSSTAKTQRPHPEWQR